MKNYIIVEQFKLLYSKSVNQLISIQSRLSVLTSSSLILSLLVYSSSSNAALSATIANTIQGNPPALSFDGGISVAANLDALVSLTMPDPSGGATRINITPTAYPTNSPINAKLGAKFSDFTTKVTADGSKLTLPATYYYDVDDDIADPTSPVGGSLKAIWTYQLGSTTKTITNAELNNPLEACNAPYTLTLVANNVEAKSQYGDPNINHYGSKTHIYRVNVADYRICYAKPANMNINNTGWDPCSTANCAYASGYNADVFVPNFGFLPKGDRNSAAANAIDNFPTSGFDYAQFTLEVSNSPNDYTFTSSDSVFAPVNNQGVVVFNNAGNRLYTNKTVTITATPNDTAFPPKDYQFTVKSTQWARVPTQMTPTGTAYNTNGFFGGNYPAAELCGAPITPPSQLNGAVDHITAGDYFFKRSDFTSAPAPYTTDYYDIAAGINIGTPSLGGHFSRDINGKFMDEWGALYDATVAGNTPYLNSGFGVSAAIWTAKAYANNYQFLVISNNGYVSANDPFNYGLAVCK